MNNPCKNCDKRHPECHSSCEDYKEFRAECDRIMKKREQINLSTPDPSKIIKRLLKAKARNKKCRIE